MHRILFVDDEPSIPRSLQRMVRSYSLEAETETAGSAEAALERVMRGGIDVVVTDVRMPGMDGVELLTRLKANPATQHIPVIMLTGSDESSVKNVALDLGASEFVSKPADPTELCARLRNVMRLKAYHDQLARQNDILTAQIVQAQKMEIAGILASQAAHDLNNIMSAIVGNAELVMNKTDNPDINPQLQRVIQAARHAAHLVRQIRDLGRHSSAEAQSSDAGAVVEESLDLLKVLVPKDIAVEWTNPELRLHAEVKASSLHQVLMNLLINAVHAMDKAGTLTVQVSERTLSLDEADAETVAPGHFVVVTVGDTGCGISPEALPHIFEPFFTTKSQGTGIGLSVVDRIVRDKGGFVKVESSPGVGTTFSVHIPVQTVSAELADSKTVPVGTNR